MRIYQITKEFQCQTTVYIDCPRNKDHRKTVSLKQTFSTQLPEGARGGRCNSQLRYQMFKQGNDWIRSTDWSVPYRYNKSVDWLLSEEGFSRGPLRQLYVEHTDNAVPAYPGYHNVIIVHTRHPVEMMVSAYHCIANPSVCPVRSKFLGPHVPINDTISNVDDFVLQGLRRPGSTPYAILQRNLQIMQFMRGFASSDLAKAGRMKGCAPPTLLHSKYELMVTKFSTWAKQILDVFIEGKGQRRTLLATLVAQYKNDFVPDGKHKHTQWREAHGSSKQTLACSCAMSSSKHCCGNWITIGLGMSGASVRYRGAPQPHVMKIFGQRNGEGTWDSEGLHNA